MTNINNPSPPLDLLHKLQALPVLHGLPQDTLEVMAEGAQCREHRAGALLFREGSPARHWLVVEQGCVEMVRYGHDGQELVFHRFQAGDSVAEPAMFMAHGRYPMTARAGTATRTWRLGREALHRACEAHPHLALHLLQEFSRRLYHYINEVQWLMTSNAPQRLAAYLLRLPSAAQGSVTLPLSQRQLAAYLGIRAETLSRMLADWQARQWLRGERRTWTLLDPAPLQELAFGRTRPF